MTNAENIHDLRLEREEVARRLNNAEALAAGYRQRLADIEAGITCREMPGDFAELAEAYRRQRRQWCSVHADGAGFDSWFRSTHSEHEAPERFDTSTM